MRRSLITSVVVVTLLTAAAMLVAQDGKTATDPKASPDDRRFTSRVDIVVAPTTVTDKDGSYVPGLKPSEFQLYDNDKLQEIRVDEVYAPISLVVAIQADAKVEGVLPKIKKLGTMFESMVAGD